MIPFNFKTQGSRTEGRVVAALSSKIKWLPKDKATGQFCYCHNPPVALLLPASTGHPGTSQNGGVWGGTGGGKAFLTPCFSLGQVCSHNFSWGQPLCDSPSHSPSRL